MTAKQRRKDFLGKWILPEVRLKKIPGYYSSKNGKLRCEDAVNQQAKKMFGINSFFELDSTRITDVVKLKNWALAASKNGGLKDSHGTVSAILGRYIKYLRGLTKNNVVYSNNNTGAYYPNSGGDIKSNDLEDPSHFGSGKPVKKPKEDDHDNIFIGRNIIFYGAPGTGKSRSARVITEEGGTSNKLPEYLRKDKYVKTLPKSSKVFRTTFHPATNYASFVGSYKPCMNGTNIVYDFRPQVFLKAYICACQNPQEPVYLIIEEINRGQCAEIFGDLFQLLDRKNGVSEDPVEPDEDIKQYLRKQDLRDYAEQLKLPANLFIIATMNTSDQSLFPMDSAFKRRWLWKYVKIDYDKIEGWTIIIAGEKYGWSSVLKAINKYIRDQKKATDKQMGEFFIKSDDKGVVDYEDFRDKVLFYLFNDVFKGNRGFKVGNIEYFEDLYEKEEADKVEEIKNWLTGKLNPKPNPDGTPGSTSTEGEKTESDTEGTPKSE